MLNTDIDDIDEMIGVVPECEPYRPSWQRVKKALVELGTTPNKQSTPCPYHHAILALYGKWRTTVGKDCDASIVDSFIAWVQDQLPAPWHFWRL